MSKCVGRSYGLVGDRVAVVGFRSDISGRWLLGPRDGR